MSENITDLKVLITGFGPCFKAWGCSLPQNTDYFCGSSVSDPMLKAIATFQDDRPHNFESPVPPPSDLSVSEAIII